MEALGTRCPCRLATESAALCLPSTVHGRFIRLGMTIACGFVRDKCMKWGVHECWNSREATACVCSPGLKEKAAYLIRGS